MTSFWKLTAALEPSTDPPSKYGISPPKIQGLPYLHLTSFARYDLSRESGLAEPRPDKGKTMMTHEILLVHDDPKVLRVIGRILKEEGYQLTEESSGEAAVRTLSEKDFDLVITDLNIY